MKIVFSTNLDAYKVSWFPDDLPFVPRIGEKVAVIESVLYHLKSQKLPTRLEVVDVTYTEQFVAVELWYNKTDKELADIAGAKTL
jgi:hypothetical protein